MYQVYVIKDNGTIEHHESSKVPSYKFLREVVGGYIQEVPHLTKYENYKRGTAIVNEEGQIKNLPFNETATKIWKENLGNAKLWYEPKIYGDMVYYAKGEKK